MKVFIFYWIKALIVLVAGALMLLLPSVFASWFDVSLGEGGVLLEQLAGVMLIGIAFICFYASRSESSLTIRNMMFSIAIMDTLGFLVLLFGLIGAVLGAAGVVLVLLWGVFAVGAWIYWFIGGQTV